MKKLLQTVTLAAATGLAACSTVNLAEAKNNDDQTLEYTETQNEITNTQEETQQETRNILENRRPEGNINIPVHKLNELMDELHSKRLNQFENLGEYVYYTKLLLNEIKVRGIIDYGENLDFDLNTIISNKRSKALLEFQKKFNRLLPGEHQISVDGKFGKETIGAILTVLHGEFNQNLPNLTLEIFYVASHNKEYYAQKRREWAEADEQDRIDRIFYDSMDQEVIEFFKDGFEIICSETDEEITIPEGVDSIEAGMALWEIWIESKNKHKRDCTCIHQRSYCRRLPKMYIPQSLKENIAKQLIPYLERLSVWNDTEASPTNFYKALIVKD